MTFLVCGIDEVGRGALAGPLIAVAALFEVSLGKIESADILKWAELATDKSPIFEVNDSKKLTASKRREIFYRILKSNKFVDFGIGEISVDEINEVGIEQANQRAFKRSVADISKRPDFILIDGINSLVGWGAKQHCEAKADEKYWPVGAASILAKVIRDSYMTEIGLDHPEYYWKQNAGYGSEQHRSAILDKGITPHHRTKFVKGILTK